MMARKKVLSWVLFFTLVFSLINTPVTAAADPVNMVLANVALGKPVLVPDWESINPQRITDGNRELETNGGTGYVGVGDYLRWIQIDLGKVYDVEKLCIVHYYNDSRRLKDVIYMLSNDPDFEEGVTIVFNNDHDNSAGWGTGTDEEFANSKNGNNVAFEPVSARYVRLYSGGNSNGSNIYNHYYEAEVWALVPEVTAPPDVPTNFSVDTAFTTSMKLKWDYDYDLSYNIYRSESSSGVFTKVNQYGIYAGSYTDKGLSPNTAYYYKISAVNMLGESDCSAELAAVTGDYVTAAVINIPAVTEVGALVCIDGSYSTGKNPMGGADDISGIMLYSWDLGDGTVISGDALNTVTHKYEAAGSYTITLTATDFRGISGSAVKNITVLDTMAKVQPAGFTSAAINDAISSLGGQPGVVILPEGTYSITSGIRVPSNVTLQGAGEGTVLDASFLAETENNAVIINGDNTRITNLAVIGPGTAKTGINVYGNKNVLIDNCETSYFEIATSISYYSSVTLLGNHIHNNTKSGLGYGIMIVSGSYAMIRDNLFENNRHAVAGGGSGSESGWRTSYDMYYNTFGACTNSTEDVSVDAHAGTQGRLRVVGNYFKDHKYSIGFRDGWGEITGNIFENISQYICKIDTPLYSNGVTIPGGGCHDFVIDDNQFINVSSTKWRILYGTGNITLNGTPITPSWTGDINIAPKTADYEVTTEFNTAVSGKVVAVDYNDDKMMYALENAAENGAAAVNEDGSWIYTPDIDYTGTDSFTVAVSDGNGGIAVSAVNITVNGKAIVTILKNVALGKPVRTATSTTGLGIITDGNRDTEANGGTGYVGVGQNLQWIQIDLGEEYDVEMINAVHYYVDGRRLKDVIYMLSNDPNFGNGVTVVFNNDSDNSAGWGAGTNAEFNNTKEGNTVVFDPISARYVRLYSGGNSNGSNLYNHYFEVEVWARVPAPTTPPEAPSGLSANALNPTSIRLSWAYDSEIIHYNVYRSDSIMGEYIKINSMGIEDGAYIDTSLAPVTTYYYKVSAVNNVGESDLSAAVEAATPDYTTVAVIHAPSVGEINSMISIDGSQSTGQNPLGWADDKSGIAIYSWDFGDGATASGDAMNMVTHEYAAAGNYTVKLTATDFNGRSSTAARVINIVDALPRVYPDGFTSTAIMNAISALNNQPGIVVLSEGEYNVTSLITIPAIVTLQGSGKGTVLNNTGTTNTIQSGGNNIRVTNMVINGPGTTRTGVYVYGHNNALVDNCEIFGFTVGNQVSYYSSVQFLYNYIHDNPTQSSGYGITVISGSYAMIRENLFENNRHAIAGGGSGSQSGWRTSYDLYNNTFGLQTIATEDVSVDAHAGTQGRIRVVGNHFINHAYSIGFRDGWGQITDNVFENITEYIAKFDIPLYSNGDIIDGAGCHNWNISNNRFINCFDKNGDPIRKWRILYGMGNIVINGVNIDHMIPDNYIDINIAPMVNDYEVTTDANMAVSGIVTAIDYNDDVLTYELGADAVNGAVIVEPDGRWTYTPDKNFMGDDSFTVIVSDVVSKGINSKTAISAIKITVKKAPVLIDVKAEAYVVRLNGSQNTLCITVTEIFDKGGDVVFRWDGLINNNTAGTYNVGPYLVYVNTKGNDQIRDIYIVEDKQ